MTEARRHDVLAIAFLALLGTFLYFDVVVGTNNFYMRDLTRYYYPTKQILRDVVLHGEFPYWNRHFGGGQPIAANPEHEVFYPLTWLILLPSYDFGYRLHILVHIYIGLLGMYAFLRSMQLRVSAAVFGALAWGIGGIYLSYVNLLPILFCAAWLPLTCLYVRKFLIAPSLRDFSLASLFLGLQFTVGEPTTVMQTGFLIGMYALYRGWYAARDADLPISSAVPEMIARVAFIGLMSVSAIAVGAAQMIPAIDHVKDSARSRVFDFSLVSAWSLPWAKLAEVIYPNFLGYISVERIMWYWGGGLYPGMGSPFLFSIYSGLFVIALVMAAFFVRVRGGRFVLIMSVFSLLIALGGHTPLLAFLHKIGVATSIRYPEKFILIAVFAVIVFSSQLFHRLVQGDTALRDAAMGFVAATTIVATLFALIGFTPYYAKGFGYVWGYKGAILNKLVALSRLSWIIAAIRGAVLLGILWAATKLKRPLWLTLVAVFVLADLVPIAEQINPRMPSEFFVAKPAVLAQLPEKTRNDYRIFHDADWHGQEEIAKQYFSTGDAVYWVVRNGIFPMTPGAYNLSMVIDRDYDKTALLPTIDFVDSVWDIKRSGRNDWFVPVMYMSNAWYRGVYKPFELEKKRVGGDMKKAVAVRFDEAEHAPRYYFADQLVTIRDRHDFVRKLSDNSYGRNVAFVTMPAFVPAHGTVRNWRETANTADIDVDTMGKSFLVMSVTPHKYWRITIDGRPADAVVTNIGYQGVVVPAGRHRVSMRYRNTLAAGGAKISIAATLLLLAGACVPRRKFIPL